MTPQTAILLLSAYFGMLIIISLLTSKRSDQDTFFTGNRNNPWWLIAFGMLGSTISGVTFISVPGAVGGANWSYFQVVAGYMLGYLAIGTILMPMYYRLKLVSIYQYLEQRFGMKSYRTGAIFFLVSRLIGSSLRLYLAALVLQTFIFDAFDTPFVFTVVFSVMLIYLYTFRAGIKTIVWTDTLQTLFLLGGMISAIWLISQSLGLDLAGVYRAVKDSPLSDAFVWDWGSRGYFWKHFIGGAFIAITMTGLDQEMMQKNLSCRSLKDAQKNMLWFSITLFFVNVLFLSLGVLLYLYGQAQGVIEMSTAGGKLELLFREPGGALGQIRTDQYFPRLALNYLGPGAALAFILGVIASTYASADAALTGLTTSFCVDLLRFEHRSDEAQKRHTRMRVHFGLSAGMIVVIMIFHAMNDAAVIDKVLELAGYTYGPLLGLYAFGLFTRWQVHDGWTPIICLLSPLLSYGIKLLSDGWAYKFGYEILLVNGAITFLGLWLARRGREREGGA